MSDFRMGMYYVNHIDGAIQQTDPRPTDDGDPLPEGWTKEFDVDGDVYYVDHNSRMQT